jgi:hypothetical protein
MKREIGIRIQIQILRVQYQRGHDTEVWLLYHHSNKAGGSGCGEGAGIHKISIDR